MFYILFFNLIKFYFLSLELRFGKLGICIVPEVKKPKHKYLSPLQENKEAELKNDIDEIRYFSPILNSRRTPYKLLRENIPSPAKNNLWQDYNTAALSRNNMKTLFQNSK